MHMPENTGGDFQSCPAGNHVAVCYRVLDLGTQKSDFQGQVSMKRKVLITWEIPDELMDDGRPFSVSKKYTFSSHEKATFRKDLESWRGVPFQDSDFGPGGFDIKNLLGKGCMLNVIHEEKGDKTYTNIASIARMPKGMNAPAPVNAITYFTLEKPDWAIYDALSQGLRDQIAKSPEYHDARFPGMNQAPQAGGYNQSIGAREFDEEVAF